MDAAGTKFYFGLAGTNSTNGQQAIEFFDPSKQRFLEYDVAKLIYELAHPQKPVVALALDPADDGRLRSRRAASRASPGWSTQQAQQLFDVRTLQPTATAIDPDVRVLVLVDPKNLSPATQFAIDQFALRGGHILAFVDPLAETDQSAGNPDAGDGGRPRLAPGEAAQRLGRGFRSRRRWSRTAATR